MKRARVAYRGAIHEAYPHADGLVLADGRVLDEDSVVWLAPFNVGTIIALGLNYSDHVKELSSELTLNRRHAVADEPLAFLKSPSAVLGHRGSTVRPNGVQFMHYECELAVIIGQTIKQANEDEAMAAIAGYTVCNDYAIRDYLENWYRPNFPVKNRDGATILGPWFVPAEQVPDPHNLNLRTLVNGQIKQQGHTGQMIHRIGPLLVWLSSFMTLQPGDVILTGTPEGVVNVNVGDQIVTEIDGIGRLQNTLIAET